VGEGAAPSRHADLAFTGVYKTPLHGWCYPPFGRVVLWVSSCIIALYGTRGCPVTRKKESQCLINAYRKLVVSLGRLLRFLQPLPLFFPLTLEPFGEANQTRALAAGNNVNPRTTVTRAIAVATILHILFVPQWCDSVSKVPSNAETGEVKSWCGATHEFETVLEY